MAQVAICPQCELELSIPDGASPAAWAKCPECRAFFQLTTANSRDLPALLLVEDGGEAAEDLTAPTVSDTSSVATWTIDSDEDLNKVAAEEDELEPETLAFEPPPAEAPEDTAQRIDAWFRSAKTLPDLQQVVNPAEETSDELTVEPDDQPAASPATNATIDLGAHGIGDAELDDDFELETPADVPQDIATWDDSQHMDRLLAGIESQPIDEFAAASRERSDDAEEPFQQAAAWSPDESPSITTWTDKPRRKRSLVRTLVVTAFGGIVGLGLGYYALLWLRGPEIDFLEVAQYLPKSILPPSFKAAPKQLAAAAPIRPAPDVAPAEKNDDAASPAAEVPSEKQASFTESATPETTGPAGEPAVLEAPPAKPLTEESQPADVIHINGAPTFTADELSAALQAAKDAQPNLVKGSLTDGPEVQRAKGAGYLALADLAQKVMFVVRDDSSQTSQQADELFRQTLFDARTRGEVAQIVEKWIVSPKRRHGGVFFAGSVTSQETKGTVTECVVDLGTGQSLTVLLPEAAAPPMGGPPQPIAVVGWIVDRPAENVTGYIGTAPQAIFANQLITLE